MMSKERGGKRQHLGLMGTAEARGRHEGTDDSTCSPLLRLKISCRKSASREMQKRAQDPGSYTATKLWAAGYRDGVSTPQKQVLVTLPLIHRIRTSTAHCLLYPPTLHTRRSWGAWERSYNRHQEQSAKARHGGP